MAQGMPAAAGFPAESNRRGSAGTGGAGKPPETDGSGSDAGAFTPERTAGGARAHPSPYLQFF